MRSHAGRTSLLLMLAAASTVLPSSVAAQDVGQMSIEELMNVEVTSASRVNRRLADTSAAVFVLTSEDIRRSGATSIPDALRLVPGVQVGRLDSNKWSVSVRGFNGRYSNKLLVLVDGRSVYTPLMSGVIWDSIDVPVDTIERVEIVRGPGATLWGANAVNGVINILTRSATAYEGVHVMVGSGSEDRGLVTVGAARALGTRTAVRVDMRAAVLDGSVDHPLTRVEDDTWNTHRLGARLDARLSERDDLVVQGGHARSNINDTWLVPSLTAPYYATPAARSRHENDFGNLAWTRRDGSGQTGLRFALERSMLDEFILGERRHTFDVDFQRTQRLAPWNEMVVGAAYRRSSDEITSSPWAATALSKRTLQWQSAFAQNEADFLADHLHLTVGAKAEHNDFTGWEVQPNVRGLVSVASRHTVWAAVSRAVRLPSRVESDTYAWLATVTSPESPLPQLITSTLIDGRPRAEELVAREVGYRYRFNDTASVDVSVYDNSYHHLRTVAPPLAPALSFDPAPHVTVLLPTIFSAEARRRGVEVSAAWRPVGAVRVTGYVSWLKQIGTSTQHLTPVPLVDDPPAHQSVLRVATSMSKRLELDGDLRYVSRLEITEVPAYTTADARLGIRFSSCNLALVGRNLLDAHHLEFVPDVLSVGRAAAERAFLVQLTFNH